LKTFVKSSANYVWNILRNTRRNKIDKKTNKAPSPEELQDFFNKLKEYITVDLKQTDIERATRPKVKFI